MFFYKKIDFLAIGDTTVDAFIKLKDTEKSLNLDKKNRKLCFSFGEKIPYESVEIVPAAGNSANAAVCAARLGLKSALLTNVGSDRNGKDCLESLEKSGVDTSFTEVQSNKKTNYHHVLSYEGERTILVKHEEYNYKFPEKIKPPKWIYLSSLAENSLPYHEKISEFLEKNPEVKLAFQPGTFQIKLGFEKLSKIYARAEIVFCNKEEAQRILNLEEKDAGALAKKMSGLGPKMAAVTDGVNGAYIFDGKDVWFQPIYNDRNPPVNLTGAGDSFAATFTSALVMGKTVQEALMWAPINAASVIQHIGAQKGLLTLAEIQTYLSKAPESYKPKKLSDDTANKPVSI